jgi:hypothetical protein
VGQKQSVKIILTTQSEDQTFTFLQDIAKETLCNRFVTKVEQLTGSDLTTRSLAKLLQKRVKFLGARISLNALMSEGSPAANFCPFLLYWKKRNLRLLIQGLLQVPTMKFTISPEHSLFRNV